MEYSILDLLEDLKRGLKDPNITRVVHSFFTQKLIFVKDYLPDRTPVWRLATEDEINDFNKEKFNDEI